MNYQEFTEMNSQLKYFYLIDTDALIKDIKAKQEALNSEELINYTFDKIFSYAHAYTKFIYRTENSPLLPFFGEPIYSSYFTGLSSILYEILKDNCIIHSFLTLTHAHKQSIEICGKNSNTIRKGFFGSNELQKDTYKSHDSDLAAKYHNYKKRYYQALHPKVSNSKNNGAKKDNVSDNITHYSAKILEQLTSCSELNIGSNGYPSSSACFSYIADYLFTASTVSRFSEKLIKETKTGRNLFTAYTNVYNDSFQVTNKLSNILDQIISETELNGLYGFSYFKYVGRILHDLASTTTFSMEKPPKLETKDYLEMLEKKVPPCQRPLKAVEGQQLLNIMLSASDLPLYYNKHFFVKYAISAFEKSEHLHSSYLSETHKHGFTRIEDFSSEMQELNNGLLLLDNYFNILKNLTVPILYALWETVSNSLYETPSLCLDSYISYITKNAKVICYDFTNLSDQLILELGKKQLTSTEIYKDFSKLIDQFDNFSVLGKDDFFPKFWSSYTKQNITYLLKQYCDIDRLKQYRFPLLQLEKSHFYNPLSKLTRPLLQIYNSPNPRDNYHKTDFQLSHLKNLNNYVITENSLNLSPNETTQTT